MIIYVGCSSWRRRWFVFVCSHWQSPALWRPVESHAVPQRCSRDREGGCELRHTDRGMADRQTGASLSAHTDQHDSSSTFPKPHTNSANASAISQSQFPNQNVQFHRDCLIYNHSVQNTLYPTHKRQTEITVILQSQTSHDITSETHNLGAKTILSHTHSQNSHTLYKHKL